MRSVLRQLDAPKDVYYTVIDQFGHCDVEIKRDKHLAWVAEDKNDGKSAADVKNHAACISHVVNVGSEKIIRAR